MFLAPAPFLLLQTPNVRIQPVAANDHCVHDRPDPPLGCNRFFGGVIWIKGKTYGLIPGPANTMNLGQVTFIRKRHMISEHSRRAAERAKEIYAERLQHKLEAEHGDQHVAIEPESGDHFVADSFSEAVAAARSAHPDRICFVIWVGHEAAIHIGGIAT
jgi:hypothetical protein